MQLEKVSKYKLGDFKYSDIECLVSSVKIITTGRGYGCDE